MSGQTPDCRVCKDPRVGDMHAMLASGVSQNRTAAAFSIPLTTFKYHVREHLPKAEPKAPDGQGPDSPEFRGEAGRRIHALAAQADALMAKAQKSGTIQEQSAATNSAKNVLALLGKLTGELNPNAERRLLETPEWRFMQEGIVKALSPFPEARQAVIAFLTGIHSSSSPMVSAETTPEPSTSEGEPEDEP